MSKRAKLRFLKVIMIYSLAMSTLVTLVALLIGWRSLELSSGTVSALCVLWSIELALGAWIKISEGKAPPKAEKTINTEESI